MPPIVKKLLAILAVVIVIWIFVDPQGAAEFVKTLFGGLWTGAQRFIEFLQALGD